MNRMMARIVLLVAVAYAFVQPAIAQQPERPKVIVEQQGNVTSLRTDGNLAATRDLGCISLDQVSRDFTPPDLHTGIASCIAVEDYDRGMRLFLLAGMYSSFDAERIVDVTARDGGAVLIMQTFAAVTPERRGRFSESINRLSKDPELLKSVCHQVANVGFPTYFPKYMVLHGMNALASGSPLDNALIPDFDAAKTWRQLQAGYLHCPL